MDMLFSGEQEALPSDRRYLHTNINQLRLTEKQQIEQPVSTSH